MRIMARITFPIFHRLVLKFCRMTLLLEIVVTIKTQLPIGFDRQSLVIRAMRIMASQALPVLSRLMPCFRGFRERIMAGETKRLPLLQQHFWISRPVRIVTGRALAIIGGLGVQALILE